MNLSLQVVENQAHSRSKKLVKKLRSFPCSTIPQNWLNVFIAMKATEGGSSNIYLPSQFYECQVPGWKAGSIIAYDLWDGTPLASDPQAPDHQSHNDYLCHSSFHSLHKCIQFVLKYECNIITFNSGNVEPPRPTKVNSFMTSVVVTRTCPVSLAFCQTLSAYLERTQ